MLIQATLTETREITKEVKLPYHAKVGENTFYRINRNGSILKAIVRNTWVNIDFTLKDGFGYKNLLKDVGEAKECDEIEVLNAIEFSCNLVDQNINDEEKSSLSKV